MSELLLAPLKQFATIVAEKLTLPGRGEPEDQLRAPLETFLTQTGNAFHMRVLAKGEALLAKVGKPDYAVYSNGTLCGYIELKQPGKGADVKKYTGHDQRQWERYKILPNILYSDGSEWALYQNGERIADIVALAGNGVGDGGSAVEKKHAASIERLLREFLTWNPIVPSSARELAILLAPICRLLRDEVLENMANASSPFSLIAKEWRATLFPGENDAQFADAYAQTVTFALLLARSEGGDVLNLSLAERQLASDHALLGKALKIFTDNLREDEFPLAIGLLQRIIANTPEGGWSSKDKDPWLYFYEDFLKEYNPKLREDAGVYYTPVQVVGAMVRLTEDILMTRLGKNKGFASPDVMTLDPAAGTGTYPLGIIAHTTKRIAAVQGEGAAAGIAETLCRQLHGFEKLVGPYAVAQLRLSRAFSEFGASPVAGGPQVYLTDTLESPNVSPEFPSLLSRELSEQHEKALRIKQSVPILVCIGNPPYGRHEKADADNQKETGGWVRWDDEDANGLYRPDTAILNSFIAPALLAGKGEAIKNLYNLYVYFWRWALWKVFEQGGNENPGVVAFITASSFLAGPAFCGMREHMRRLCHEILIVDLGGEGRGSRKEENVFAIQTPVCIALAIRRGQKAQHETAQVRYTRLSGNREEKLRLLDDLEGYASMRWEECPSIWQSPFKPGGEGRYFDNPLLTDLMPWQQSGAQFKRTWPIAPDEHSLQARWKHLLLSTDRASLFKESRDRNIKNQYRDLQSNAILPALFFLPENTNMPQPTRYGYRSFDRQLCLLDNRLGDYLRPSFIKAHSQHQLYLASVSTQPLSQGPALALSADIPDLHYFRGSFGAKDILPLYCNSAATEANILPGLLKQLSSVFGFAVFPEDFAAYVYAVLAHSDFTERFYEELESQEIRVPLTKSGELFQEAVSIGRHLIWLHSYGERLIPKGEVRGVVPSGSARCLKSVPGTPDSYPDKFQYIESTQTLCIGDGEFAPVSHEVFNFEVSGLKVLHSWLKYRMKDGAGKRTSPLDYIRTECWTSEFTSELLNLLWILEHTLASYPEQKGLLDGILKGPLFTANELPEVPQNVREAPEKRKTKKMTGQYGLPI